MLCWVLLRRLLRELLEVLGEEVEEVEAEEMPWDEDVGCRLVAPHRDLLLKRLLVMSSSHEFEF